MRRLLFLNRRRRQRPRLPKPSLRFTPTAWGKLLYLRDRGDTEIGGFGVSAADNLLRVADVVLVRQVCTPMTVAFDDVAVAEFFDAQIDAGRTPQQVGRLWIHTHPGDSPFPSSTDEETFARVFGRCDWAVMFILARGGQTYARLQWNVGPGGALQIPVEVDFSRPFAGSDQRAWEAEYQGCVMSEWPEPWPALPPDSHAELFLEEWMHDEFPVP
jgi:proteasome lid subunit RPN8/RPN11